MFIFLKYQFLWIIHEYLYQLNESTKALDVQTKKLAIMSSHLFLNLSTQTSILLEVQFCVSVKWTQRKKWQKQLHPIHTHEALLLIFRSFRPAYLSSYSRYAPMVLINNHILRLKSQNFNFKGWKKVIRFFFLLMWKYYY